MAEHTLRHGQSMDSWSPSTLVHKDSRDLLKDDCSTNSPPLPRLRENGSFEVESPTLRKMSSALHKQRSMIGLAPQAPLQDEHDYAAHNHLWWAKVKVTLKEPFAEMWGTFILVLFGK